MVSLNHEDTFWGKLQLGVSHSIYLSISHSISIYHFFSWKKKKDKAYLQFDLQISVDLRTDNEIKKMILIKKKIFFFFLIMPYHFKRWKKFRIVGKKKPLAREMGISRLLGKTDKKILL